VVVPSEVTMKIGAGAGTHVVAVAGSNPTQYLIVDAHGSAPTRAMTELELRAILLGGGMADAEVNQLLVQARRNPR
jgi:hypothetical protein